MNYRKISDKEATDFAKLETTAFFMPLSDAQKQIDKDKYQLDTIRGAYNDDNELVAGLRLIEYQMNIDGTFLKCGGIGSVSSYPEYRKQGNISFLFKNLLNEMYKSGYALSYLYPFSHPFYRKYGYETAHEFLYYSLPTAQLQKYDKNGTVKKHIPNTLDDNLDDIISIYEQYADKYNLMISRDYSWWKLLYSDDAFESEYKTYVYYDENNQPISYIKYIFKKTSIADVDLQIYDYAFTDYKSLLLILGFVTRLLPYVKFIKMLLPEDMKIIDIIDEPHEISREYEAGGMARIVNVQKALEALIIDNLTSDVTIKVTDDYIKENNNTYIISRLKGTIDIANDKNADLECSIQALAQLVIGYRNIDNLLFIEKVKVNSNIDALRQLFTTRITHIQDRF